MALDLRPTYIMYTRPQRNTKIEIKRERKKINKIQNEKYITALYANVYNMQSGCVFANGVKKKTLEINC